MTISLILIFPAIVSQLYLTITSYSFVGIGGTIANVLTLVALIASFMYVFTEYKKSSSKYFKLFLICYAVTYLWLSLDGAVAVPLLVMIFDVLILLLLVILLVAKDLGKNKSVFIALAIFALELASGFAVSVSGLGIPYDVDILPALSRLTIPIVLVIMIFLKYSDKQLRGTK